jgi:hypothetical protein
MVGLDSAIGVGAQSVWLECRSIVQLPLGDLDVQCIIVESMLTGSAVSIPGIDEGVWTRASSISLCSLGGRSAVVHG